MTFDKFMEECNRICLEIVHMRCDDLPDWCYWDSWDDGATPRETILDLLEYEGFAV